jgi:predicted Zn finger-like uncharacterized protein
MAGQPARESPPVITICPQCQLPLAVTAADLRIAQGQVRCGRCAAVFNALASLYEPPASADSRAGAPASGGVPDSTDAFQAAPADAAPAAPAAPAGPGPGATASPTVALPYDGHPQDSQPDPSARSADEPSTDAFQAGRDALPPAAAAVTAAAPPPASAAPAAAWAVSPAPTPAPPERDWEIDTMTAAELAALVARSDRDEPAELASIQIAVDEESEITVLPSELPRLDALPADDPEIGRARAAAAERMRGMGRNGSSLRWLELEPAQPAPGSLAASLGLAAEADFGARTGTGTAIGNGEIGDGIDALFDAQPAPADERSGIEALAAQLRGAGRGRTALDLDLGPPLEAEPRHGPYAAALDELPPAAVADPALEIAATGAQARSAPASRGLWAATVVLGLALGAQLVHLYREELVAIPALAGPLTRVYAALGRPVAPRWEVGRYEVRQQGVVAEPVAAGTLTVRASIRNGAARAQPAPLLRVILQDRFGNRIATRDLTPREYGGAAAIAPAPMLAPGQRIDAEVSLLDPGGEAVGFELDVCLRRPDATVSCANDAQPVNG